MWHMHERKAYVSRTCFCLWTARISTMFKSVVWFRRGTLTITLKNIRLSVWRWALSPSTRFALFVKCVLSRTLPRMGDCFSPVVFPTVDDFRFLKSSLEHLQNTSRIYIVGQSEICSVIQHVVELLYLSLWLAGCSQTVIDGHFLACSYCSLTRVSAVRLCSKPNFDIHLGIFLTNCIQIMYT